MIRYKDFECGTVEEAVALMRALTTDSDGWITWNGGENPLPHSTQVECIRRDGSLIIPTQSYCRRWDHNGGKYDIVAYRIVK